MRKQTKNVYFIKVTLTDWYGRVKGQPFRVLAIPENYTLYKLAASILGSFGFAFDHPFGFYDNINKWTRSDEGYELFADIGEESEFKGVEKTNIKAAFNKVGKKMLFLFDYGDEWHFITELQGIELQKEKVKYPLIVESFGEAPPQYGEEEE